jgi:hypothetical protein
MKDYTYFFEIKNLLTQFVAAFDETTIKRYNKDREPGEVIEVRYVLAPKQRVMYDIVNKAQNLTLPVVAVNVTSISRDNERVFNKLNNIHNFVNEKDSRTVRMPVPINISVSMSILTRYMDDMDQILSNFIPFNNPYIILSWKEPTGAGNDVFEIRSEVLWDGNISLSSPTDTTYTDKFRVVADTSFTIKGWLFKDKNEIATPIYFIDTNFSIPGNNTSLEIYSDTDLDSLSATDIETVSLSAYPTITNLWHNYQSNLQPVYTNLSLNGALTGSNNFVIYGYNFDYTTAIALSSNNKTLYNSLTSFSTARMGTVSGFKLSSYEILSQNILSVTLPYTINTGLVDVMIINPAGYASTSSISGVDLRLNFSTAVSGYRMSAFNISYTETVSQVLKWQIQVEITNPSTAELITIPYTSSEITTPGLVSVSIPEYTNTVAYQYQTFWREYNTAFGGWTSWLPLTNKGSAYNYTTGLMQYYIIPGD